MKNKSILHIFLLLVFTLNFSFLHGQRSEWVNQVIISNGGKFESQPYTDYVTVEAYNPVTKVANVFNTIYTQSTQDVVINGNVAYVAAQDSIVMYNIDSYQRMAAIADSGLSKLYYTQGKLIVTKQYPVKRFYVEILDASNLALLGLVQGISGDCGAALMFNDILYVAVDSGYQGTRGRLAIINPAANWQLVQEVDLGTDAVGIWNLYSYNEFILSVNKTPFGGLNAGSISAYDVNNGTFQNKVFDVRFGNGYGIKDNLLYLNINDGIGSVNLDTREIADTTIIPPPGVGGNIVIHSAAIDYVNNQFYVNIGNYTTFGIGVIADLAGDSLGSYTTGINAEGMAIDYRAPSSVSNGKTGGNQFSFQPNPATDWLTLNSTGDDSAFEIKILDITGRVVYTQALDEKIKNLKISCGQLPAGIYLLSVTTNNGVISRKFVRK